MALDEAAILDTQYAYDVAVGVARWQEDYASWESEALYRQNQKEADVAYREESIAYDKAREQQRFDEDVVTARNTLAAKQMEAANVVILQRQDQINAQTKADAALRTSAETAATQKLNAAAFGGGRSSSILLRQVNAEGAEEFTNISLQQRLQDDVRSNQLATIGQAAVSALESVTAYTEPLEPAEIAEPVQYRPPIYVKPLEPNLEEFAEGVTESNYINADPESTEALSTSSTGAISAAQDQSTAYTDAQGLGALTSITGLDTQVEVTQDMLNRGYVYGATDSRQISTNEGIAYRSYSAAGLYEGLKIAES